MAGRAPVQPPLYLGRLKLDLSSGRRLVFRLPVGAVGLTDDAPGPFATRYCDILVRKDRISAITVRLDTPPRCQCEIPSGTGTASLPSCM